MVFGSVLPSAAWRPLAGVVGIVAYGACILAASRALLRLVAAGVVGRADVDACCTVSYWIGGCVVTLASVFNPVSSIFILTSGAATGFGAMVGLLALPVIIRRDQLGPSPAAGTLRITAPWVVAGVVSTVLFVCVMGPGIRLS